MELIVNQTLEVIPEPIAVSHFTTQGLLNSHYQSIVKQNFRKSTKKSVFGIRQRLKASQFNMSNYTIAALKLSVFAMVLIALF